MSSTMRYRIFMPKTAISVTLNQTNLLWLKARMLATKGRSVSEALDDLVTAARTSGTAVPGSVRSVVGTVDLAADDPNLDFADAYVREVTDASLARPFLVRETPAGAPAPRRPRRG